MSTANTPAVSPNNSDSLPVSVPAGNQRPARKTRSTEKGKFVDTAEEPVGDGRPPPKKKGPSKNSWEPAKITDVDPTFSTRPVAPAPSEIRVTPLRARKEVVPPAQSPGQLTLPLNATAGQQASRRLSAPTAARLQELRNPFTPPSSVPRAPARQNTTHNSGGSSRGRSDATLNAARANTSTPPPAKRTKNTSLRGGQPTMDIDDEDGGSDQEPHRRGSSAIREEHDAIVAEYNARPREDAFNNASGGYISDGQDDDDEEPQGNEDSHRDDDRDTTADTGNKRRRSPTPPPTRQAITIQESKGRPKAGDYETAVRHVLSTAIAIYRCRLTSENPYPDGILEVTWAKAAWKEACEMCDTSLASNMELIKLITCRASHMRGELKAKVRPLVETIYGFESDDRRKAVERNRTLVLDLKEESAFVFRKRAAADSELAHSGLYENKIIQKAINVMWFKNRQDIGVSFPEVFAPFPTVGIALVLAAIECAIDEWASGARTDLDFKAGIYSTVYERHLQSLWDLEEAAKYYSVPFKIPGRISANGRAYAKADVLEQAPVRAISKDAIAVAIRLLKESNGQEVDSDEE
ncbi:hypothetical protein PLICRDRAFT_180857 [Plicaturopsis crispa FD-325 SS-3]|uniref:DUF6532 domain-containing protein n=1 Tax=Plicaturopsis crispa FD-325 SS-3 TaxID=944288 RepID=A0A0C9SVB9_PLICR|nr:hypothetical protein PLICRDRAFT_180857 [Plicaturopsis crispa FD-325 SS-3]